MLETLYMGSQTLQISKGGRCLVGQSSCKVASHNVRNRDNLFLFYFKLFITKWTLPKVASLHVYQKFEKNLIHEELLVMSMLKRNWP